jgi:hypothetical protein
MPSSTPRAIVTPGPEGLQIVIPAVRHPFVVVFLGIWLIGWCVGEVTAVTALLAGGPASSRTFLLVWLLFWSFGGAFASLTWLWAMAGAERLLMGSSNLSLKRSVFGLGFAGTYALHRMHNLRVLPATTPAQNATARFGVWGIGQGRIAFEYDERRIRFGAALADSEAQSIVDRMKARFAFPEMPALLREDGHAV